jgi:hypothetical protein
MIIIKIMTMTMMTMRMIYHQRRDRRKGDTPVPIFGVRPIIFKTALDYVYGNDNLDSMWAATMTNDEETSSSLSLKVVAIELCNAGESAMILW